MTQQTDHTTYGHLELPLVIWAKYTYRAANHYALSIMIPLLGQNYDKASNQLVSFAVG